MVVDAWYGVSEKMMMSWDFQAQPSQFTKTHPVSGSSAGGNVLLREVRGERSDWFKITGGYSNL